MKFVIVFTCGLALTLNAAVAQRGEARREAKETSEHRFEVRNIEGWTVYTNRKSLAEHRARFEETFEHLQWELYQTKLAIPAGAITNLQEKNAIWIEYDEEVDLSYHPGRRWLHQRGYTLPADARSMMSLSAKTHLDDSYRHPFVVLHELAHGYDFHFLGRGRRYGSLDSQPNYLRMMKEGKYKQVMRSSGRMGSHYAQSNHMEYFAESTEAYFAVNDFYPFVRAQLREHDPKMVDFVERYWGVDPEETKRLEEGLAAYKERTGKNASEQNPKAKALNDADYERRTIKGFAVSIAPAYREQPGWREEVMKLVTYKLHMIDHFVGDEGMAALRTVPIVTEAGDADGPYIEAVDGRVVIRDPKRLQRWILLQQSDVMHAIALAYYDRQAKAENSKLVKNVTTAFDAASASQEFKAVLRFDGRRVAHPCLAGPRDYFAHLMSSYFSVNDHYPFIRCEIKVHDKAGHDLIASLWKGNPRR